MNPQKWNIFRSVMHQKRWVVIPPKSTGLGWTWHPTGQQAIAYYIDAVAFHAARERRRIMSGGCTR